MYENIAINSSLCPWCKKCGKQCSTLMASVSKLFFCFEKTNPKQKYWLSCEISIIKIVMQLWFCHATMILALMTNW